MIIGRVICMGRGLCVVGENLFMLRWWLRDLKKSWIKDVLL